MLVTTILLALYAGAAALPLGEPRSLCLGSKSPCSNAKRVAEAILETAELAHQAGKSNWPVGLPQEAASKGLRSVEISGSSIASGSSPHTRPTSRFDSSALSSAKAQGKHEARSKSWCYLLGRDCRDLKGVANIDPGQLVHLSKALSWAVRNKREPNPSPWCFRRGQLCWKAKRVAAQFARHKAETKRKQKLEAEAEGRGGSASNSPLRSDEKGEVDPGSL